MLSTVLIAALVAAAPVEAAEPPDDDAGAPASARSSDLFQAELDSLAAHARSRAGSPEAVLPMLQAYDLRERVPSLVPLARLYAQLSRQRSSHPEVRALARYLLGHVQRSRGRALSAREQYGKLGFAGRFWVLGPFDNEGKSGCGAPLPPETSLDLNARYSGKTGEIGWRRLPETPEDGFVDLGAALQPSNETVAYALTVLEASAEQRVVLHLGASGATKLFVNGQRVLADDAYHAPRLDQAQVAVTLKKGANRVLLKLCQDSGQHGFYLRASGLNGEVDPDVRASAPDSLAAAPQGGVSREVLPTALDFFRNRADARRDARARADYAQMLHFVRSFEARDRRDIVEAIRAARMAPKDAELQLLAGRLADDANEKRQYFEAALAAQPAHAEASWALARQLLDRDLPRRALEVVEPALAKNPGYFPLGLLKARALDAMGLTVESERLVSSLQRAWSDRPEVVREAARISRRRDRSREAASYYRVALALRFDDLDSRRALVSILADLGEVEAALKEQRELDRLEPWDVYSWLRLADFAAANAHPEIAQEAFARAKEIAPGNADVFEREGNALSRLGQKEAALAALVQALALKPQNQQVREQLKLLRREGRGFGEELAYDVRKLIAETPPQPGEDTVVLGEMAAVKVLPSGLSSRFEQIVVRVQTARGVEDERSQWITYSPDRQDLKILRARVIKPDGSIIETHTETERSLSDDASKLYYDARGRVLGFPALAPGDVLEVAWRLEDTANDNLLSDYFGDVHTVQGGANKARFDYWLLAPKGRTIYANTPKLQVGKEEAPQADGALLHHWSARNVPKVVQEPGMPGSSETAALLHVSTYRDWDSVGRYWWGLVRDQLTITDEVREAVKEALKGVPPKDERAVIAAIYGWVVTKTRYVGLEFGIHGYKPYKVSQVLSRRFGDCKDKASLIHAMLKVAGIDSRLVLLRMRRLGRIDPAPASLAIFDHAIAYVPKHDLWLDGTAEMYGSRELPVQDRAAVVLVVQPDGGSQLGQIPEATAQANVTRSEHDVVLSAEGAATLRGKTVVSGLFAPDYRRTYQSPATRKQIYEQGWARSFPGVSVKKLEFDDLAAIEKDVEMAYELEIPRFAQREGERLSFAPFGAANSYVESYAALSSRKHELLLSYPWTNRFKYRLQLPEGFAPKELPAPVQVQSPFGALTVKYELQGRTLVAEGEVLLGVVRVAPAEYAAFRGFLGQIDQALEAKVKLERATPQPTAAK